MKLSEVLEERWLLGIEEMDETHREFAALVDQAAETKGEAFVALYQELIRHTAEHFRAEEQRMCDSNFPATREHKMEHERVLAEMMRMGAGLAQGKRALARSYVCERLPDWFQQHAATMDSALAGHLKGQFPKQPSNVVKLEF